MLSLGADWAPLQSLECKCVCGGGAGVRVPTAGSAAGWLRLFFFWLGDWFLIKSGTKQYYSRGCAHQRGGAAEDN